MQDHPLLNLIKERRSRRRYLPQPVAAEAINTVLTAGRQAPFAETDSRHFTVVRRPEMLERLNREAKTAGRALGVAHIAALARQENYHCLYHAPMAILVFGREDAVAPEADAAAAIENMLLAASALGLGACWVYFATLAFLPASGQELLTDLQVPPGYRPIAAVALGHADAAEILPPKRLAGSVNYID